MTTSSRALANRELIAALHEHHPEMPQNEIARWVGCSCDTVSRTLGTRGKRVRERCSDPAARDKARRLFAQGWELGDIAVALGKGWGTVRHWVTDGGAEPLGRPTENTEQRAEAVRLRRIERLTAREVAERMRLPLSTVAKWLKGVAVDTGTNWSASELATLERLWTAGASADDIAVALPRRSPPAVRTKVAELGLKRSRNTPRSVPVLSHPDVLPLEAISHPAILPSRPAPKAEEPASVAALDDAAVTRPWYLRLAPRAYLPPRKDERPATAAKPPDAGAAGGGYSMLGGRTARYR